MTSSTTSQDLAPLDGNAVAGAFAEFFSVDVTVAVLTCDRCDASFEFGATPVYGGDMGAIFRCPRCDHLLVRFVQTPSGSTLDMRGAKRLSLRRRSGA